MPFRNFISRLKRFARREDGFTSVEWVVICAALAGFAYATGSMVTNSALPVMNGTGEFIAGLEAPE
ncbi:hypothetical protein [Donghicola tyrosinivorans]|uniref:hypothetical protein n=1 Tax=Donghicola tyrosinivorans TaxID=1652492 RepID=UPI0011B25F59|nr:hypothetical protein [Donghicola tyrosinivorans]